MSNIQGAGWLAAFLILLIVGYVIYIHVIHRRNVRRWNKKNSGYPKAYRRELDRKSSIDYDPTEDGFGG